MALGTLSIDLNVKLASFMDDLGKAARAADKTAAQISGAFGIIKSAVGGLVAGIGAGGLVALTRSTVNAIDALNDVKDATGASIENISALEDVAARTGVKLDTVSTSLVKFNGVLSDAKPGSVQAEALKAIGLSAEELRRLDPAEALRRTAVALAGFADDGNKARLTQELFGKSLKEVAPFLKDLATQTELVAKVTTEQAEAAEKFNLQLFAMQKNAQDAARYLSVDLVTGLNAAADAFRNFGIAEAARVLAFGNDQFQSDKALFEAVERQLGIEKELQELRKRGFNDDSRGVQKQLADLRAVNAEILRIRLARDLNNPDNQSAAEATRLGLARPSVAFNGGGGGTATAAARERVKEIENSSRALDQYIESLKRTIEREQDLTAVQTAQLRLAEFAEKRLAESGRNYIPNVEGEKRAMELARELELQRERIALIKEAAELDAGLVAGERAAQEAAGRELLQREQRLRSLLSDTDDGRFAKIREDVALLAEAFTAGRLEGGVEQYIQAVQNAVGKTGDGVDKTKSLVDELGLSFSSAFEDAIVGGKSLQEVLKGVGQDLLRLTVRKSITEPASKYFTGLLSNVFSFDGGGYTGGAARTGGLDGKGGFMAMLHPQESVIDHTKGERAGGSTVQNFYFTVGDVATKSMVVDVVTRALRVGDATRTRREEYA